MAGIHTSATKPNITKSNRLTNTHSHPSDKLVPCNIGNVVLIKGEKIIGVVAYKGTVQWDNSNRTYIGLTLSDPIQNGHNGTARGTKYFTCPDKHGIIISSHLVSRTISSSELLQKVTNLNNAFKQCYNQSQELQRKYMQVRETLQRVEGENKSLRERLEYYESHRGRGRDNDRTNPYISQSRSPSRTISPSPSPNSRMRSKSNANTNRNRQFATKVLPPLPPNKLAKSVPPSPVMNPMNPIHMTPMVTDEPDEQSYGIPTPLTINTKNKRISKVKIKKKAYRQRKKVYRRRSNSNETFQSFKSRSHKSSYKSRKSSYKSRTTNGSTHKSSYKRHRYRNQSDVSKSTMTSTVDRCQDSPMPLSIGDPMGGTIKMLMPNINTPRLAKSYSTNTLDILNDNEHENDESESHDYQDSGTNYTRTNTRSFDDGDIVDESENELFSPLDNTSESISTRKTNTPKGSYSGSGNYGQRFISKFVPRDLEDVDDDDVLSAVLYNEENDLELGSVGASMQNIYDNVNNINNYAIKPPSIIQEDDDEDDDMDMDIDKHLAPHIVEEDVSSDNIDIMNHDMDNLSDSGTIEYNEEYNEEYDHEQQYQQMDEDMALEIETPQPVQGMNITAAMYKPHEQRNNNMNNNMNNEQQQKRIVNTHSTKPLPPLAPKQQDSNHSSNNSNKVGNNNNNNNNLNTNVHSIQYSGSMNSGDIHSIPDTVGLYADHAHHTEQASNITNLLSDTQSSARYSNTPSYTHTVTTMGTNTISPHKKPKRDFRKRYSHTPAAITLPNKFNPGKKFSSVPAAQHYRDGFISDQDDNIDMDQHNDGVFAAQSLLNNMQKSKSFHSDDNYEPRNNNKSNNSHSNYQPQSNNSHSNYQPQNININMFPQNNIGNFHNMVKRKTIGGSCLTFTDNKKSKRKIPKKRIIRSRTFVSTTESGKKYNCLETAKQLDKSTRQHQREATPDIDFAEQKSYHPISADNTPLLSPTTPKTAPFHAVNVNNKSHQITLDDFQLDHALDTDFELSQHQSHKHPGIHHKQYYSQHINSQKRKSQIPPGTPVMSNAKSEHQPQQTDFYRKSRKGKNKDINLKHIKTNNRKGRKLKKNDKRNNSTGTSNGSGSGNGSGNGKSPHRNLGSLTHHELKGLLEADNLFTYDNYQKIVK